jgi:hypothetical protein
MSFVEVGLRFSKAIAKVYPNFYAVNAFNAIKANT